MVEAPRLTSSELLSRLAAAEQAYAQLRLDDARATLEALLGELERGSGSELTTSERARAHVLSASVARANGDLAGLDAALDAALDVEPGLRLDPAAHPPPLIEALERRRALRSVEEPLPPVEQPVTPPLVMVPAGPAATDPWPWIGGGVGIAAVIGGAIVLGFVLAPTPTEFQIHGTVAP